MLLCVCSRSERINRNYGLLTGWVGGGGGGVGGLSEHINMGINVFILLFYVLNIIMAGVVMNRYCYCYFFFASIQPHV